ncbi:hypothetical protein [Bradyrhizobium sp. BR 1432]|uniref:hypothetical protein n=1 Tax=Bradyrhizobium sp. BR 1432 TaxID=3447966 RepID=UPI003EE7FBE3
MLTAIFSQFGMGIINGLLDKALDAFMAYENKTISIEELRTRLYEAMLESVKAIEVAQAQALAQTYQAFITTIAQSPLMQRVWATVLSQLFVLIYHQFGIPLIVLIIRAAYAPRWQYPSSGTTVEWAYLLLGALMGLGPMVVRAGPGAGSFADRLKAMVGAGQA